MSFLEMSLKPRNLYFCVPALPSLISVEVLLAGEATEGKRDDQTFPDSEESTAFEHVEAVFLNDSTTLKLNFIEISL